VKTVGSPNGSPQSFLKPNLVDSKGL